MTHGHYTIVIRSEIGPWEHWHGCDESFHRRRDAERAIRAWIKSGCADESYRGCQYGIEDDRENYNTRCGRPGIYVTTHPAD